MVSYMCKPCKIRYQHRKVGKVRKLGAVWCGMGWVRVKSCWVLTLILGMTLTLDVTLGMNLTLAWPLCDLDLGHDLGCDLHSVNDLDLGYDLHLDLGYILDLSCDPSLTHTTYTTSHATPSFLDFSDFSDFSNFSKFSICIWFCVFYNSSCVELSFAYCVEKISKILSRKWL